MRIFFQSFIALLAMAVSFSLWADDHSRECPENFSKTEDINGFVDRNSHPNSTSTGNIDHSDNIQDGSNRGSIDYGSDRYSSDPVNFDSSF